MVSLIEKARISGLPFLSCSPFRAAATLECVSYSEYSPHICADRFHERQTDIACLPLSDYVNHGGYTMLPFGVSVAGPGDGLLLVSEQRIESLDTILIDSSAQAYSLLVRLLLARLYPQLAARVRYCRMDFLEARQDVKQRVGALLMGHTATRWKHLFPVQLDLPHLWREEFGLPLVLSVWAFHERAISLSALDIIMNSFRDGIKNRLIHARDWADKYQLSRENAEAAIVNDFSFELTADSYRGIEFFTQCAAEMGLLPTVSVRPHLHTALPDTPSTVSARIPTFSHAFRTAKTPLSRILKDATNGRRISLAEGLRLVNEAPFMDLLLAADTRRQAVQDLDVVTYNISGTVFHTNICLKRGGLVGFYCAPGQPGGFLLSDDEIMQRVKEIVNAGGSDVILQGGLHPELTLEYFEQLFSRIKQRFNVTLNALSADEILFIAGISATSVLQTLKRLTLAGLSSLPETGGGLLVETIRKRHPVFTTSAEEWLDVHRTAHRLGITSSCEIRIGFEETWEERLLHLHRLRQLQDETNGFLAFSVARSYNVLATHLGSTWELELLKTQALARLFLDNFNVIQSTASETEHRLEPLRLHFGANDCEWRVIDRNALFSPRGKLHMTVPAAVEHEIRKIGFTPKRRNGRYQELYLPVTQPRAKVL